MKNIYKVKTERVTADWGRFVGYDEEFVTTDNIAAVIEAAKTAIENRPTWWMTYGKGDDDRPNVTAEPLTIREA